LPQKVNELPAGDVRGFLAKLSLFSEEKALGFTKILPQEKQITMMTTTKPTFFRAAYLHEAIHYLASLGLIPISERNELLTQAVTVLEMVKGGGMEELKDFGGGLYEMLFEIGAKLARENKPLFRIERLLAEAQAIIMEDENWKLFRFPSPEYVAAMPPHELERWAGPILGGYAYENEKLRQIPGLEFLFNFAKHNLALPAERRLSEKEKQDLDKLIKYEADWARRISGIPRLRVIPWHSLNDLDYPHWRLVVETEELHYVPGDLLRLTPDAVRGKIMLESLRPYYGVPLEIIEKPFDENGPFLSLFSTMETPFVVERGTKKWAGVKSWIERYLEEIQEIRDAEKAKLEMALKPAYMQCLVPVSGSQMVMHD
jgi:hypothetical protein